MFIDVTDSGPDQLARKRKTASLVKARSNNNIIYVPGPCLLHQYHLAVQDGLAFVNNCVNSWFSESTSDPPQSTQNHFRHYVGALAAISNSWRDQAAKVITEWHRSYGPEALGRQYPSCVIAGRWGSVDSAEKFLLSRGQEKTQAVILRVLSKFVKAEKKVNTKDSQQDGTATGSADAEQNAKAGDAGDDDTNTYRIRLSKWYRTTFHAISSKIFWFLLRVCHHARGPLRHFFAFMQKHSAKHCLFLLVTSRINAFKHDCLQLVLGMPVWLQEALDASGCSTLSCEVQCKLKLLAAQLVFKQNRSLDLRIIKRLEEWLVCLRCVLIGSGWMIAGTGTQ